MKKKLLSVLAITLLNLPVVMANDCEQLSESDFAFSIQSPNLIASKGGYIAHIMENRRDGNSYGSLIAQDSGQIDFLRNSGGHSYNVGKFNSNTKSMEFSNGNTFTYWSCGGGNQYIVQVLN